MKEQKKSKGILFDLDGTLWDSSENVAKAWSKVLSEKYPELHKTVNGADLHGYMGKTLNKIGELMLPHVDAEKRARIMSDCCGYENEYLKTHGGVLYPKLEETLCRLSERYGLYIVSNCQAGYIESFFEYSGLSRFFSDWECPGGSGLEKGGNNKLIIERNSLSEAVYVGDTEGDLEAAEYVGIPFIHAAYGFGTVRKCAASINTFGELPEAAAWLLD